MFSRLALCASAFFVAGPALAHPHVWIDARGEILFADDAMAGIRHHWTFDPYFSAWAIQGLDADGDGVLTREELQPLADENIVGLDDYSYYTFADPEGLYDHAAIARAHDPYMDYEDGQLTLSFTVDFVEPQAIGSVYEIEVGDPEYFVAFTFPDDDSIVLEGAPEGCAAVSQGPRSIDPALEEELWLLPMEVTELPAHLRQAARDLANLITITCPGGVPATALEAIREVTTTSRPSTPFAAPPAEPSILPNQGGFLGWIGQQQARFYLAMTEALSSLGEDSNAFWVLGGLSFIYGVFHAAGPGHGKLVISSYVLANERQLRRGILLSFLSAMMQAVVAISFVLLAAGALRLTSIAMSNAAHWMTVASYGLIALLGAWLAVRKFPGVNGHDHRLGNHDHVHDGSCHHHVVAPVATEGGWRGTMGVVLSVGMRPCSGALVVLVFALSQGVLGAGILATFLMGLGTALTVAFLASAAVFAKGGALRLVGNGTGAAAALRWAEFAGALLIMSFGLLLLFASL